MALETARLHKALGAQAQAERRAVELAGVLTLERKRFAGEIAKIREEAARPERGLRTSPGRRLAEVRTELEREKAARAELTRRARAQADAARRATAAWTIEQTTLKARITALEAALDEARSGWQSEHARAQELAQRGQAREDRRGAIELERDAIRRERDDACALAERLRTELERTQALYAAGIEARDRAVRTERSDRAGVEIASTALESRLNHREEAERAAHAARESERQVARAQRQELARVERRLAEVSSGLAISLRRLQMPDPAPARVAEETSGACEPAPGPSERAHGA